jgi:hypothetical protein
MRCLLRRDYDAATLIREHPPRWRHPHKQLGYELYGGDATTGAICVTRWMASELPATAAVSPIEVIAMRGHYDYAPALLLEHRPHRHEVGLPSEARPRGVGEVGIPPVAPAVANAFATLTGRRIRELPLVAPRGTR